MDRDQWVMLVLIGLLSILTVLLVRPFLQYLLLAALLYYILHPLYVVLAERSTPRIAAGSLVLGATGLVVLPLLIILRITLREASQFISRIRNGELTLEGLETQLFALTGVEMDLTAILRSLATELGSMGVGSALGVFGRVSHLAIGIVVTLFLLYYFLKDGSSFDRWLRARVPLKDPVYDELQNEVKQVTHAMIGVHGFIAVVQGSIAGLGLVVVGVPDALFWTVVMIFLALLPIIGSFLVWGPAALYLLATGNMIAGVFLLIYGTIVVGLTDDYLRPIVAHHYTHLNPAVIVLGITGGVYLFGFPGIFFGPIVIGSLGATLDVYCREYAV